MSLDVYLRIDGAEERQGTGIFVRDNGATREITREEWDEKFPNREPVTCIRDGSGGIVFRRNITHNLNRMAMAASVYEALWRPEDIGIRTARDLAPLLAAGLARLKSDPQMYRALNPENGWGNYEGLLAFVESYLSACETWPQASIGVSR